MHTTESLTAYHGVVQQLIQRLVGTKYAVPESFSWVIYTNRLLRLYKNSVRIIKFSFESSSYHEIIEKHQELANEDVVDTTIPLEHQRKTKVTSKYF